LDQIANFLKDRGLNLSPEKSQWIFSRNKIPSLPKLRILGSIVPRVTPVRFLGIFLDAKISGKNHLIYLIRKGSILIDILFSLAGILGGDRTLLLNLYRSIFRECNRI